MIRSAPRARKLIVTPELDEPVDGFEWVRETAGDAVPRLVARWLA